MFKPEAPVKIKKPAVYARHLVIYAGDEIHDRVFAEATKRGMKITQFCKQALKYALDNMDNAA